MTQTAAPIIAFQRKDLLVACWGNAKEADLLYHFLNKASWEVANNNLGSCKNITFKEEHDKILKLVPMAEGTLIKCIKRFNLAGYISSVRYGNTFTVNKEAIQTSFTNPPAKPMSAPRGRPKGSKVSRIKGTKNSETFENNAETSIEKSEVSQVSLINDHEKVLNLELEVLSLKEKVLILEQLVLNLKLSETREATPEALSVAKVSLQNDIEKIQNDIEIESTYSETGRIDQQDANATQTAPLSSSSQDVSQQASEEEKPFPPEQAIDSYSQASPEAQGYRQSASEPEVPSVQQQTTPQVANQRARSSRKKAEPEGGRRQCASRRSDP